MSSKIFQATKNISRGGDLLDPLIGFRPAQHRHCKRNRIVVRHSQYQNQNQLLDNMSYIYSISWATMSAKITVNTLLNSIISLILFHDKIIKYLNKKYISKLLPLSCIVFLISCSALQANQQPYGSIGCDVGVHKIRHFI